MLSWYERTTLFPIKSNFGPQGTLCTFFGISIISATTRVLIRFRNLKGVRVDDYFFLAAAISTVVAFGLILASWDRFPKNEIAGSDTAQPTNAFIEQVANRHIIILLASVFYWCTIFLIKICFLFYFRGLVDRLSKFQTLWWMNLGLLLPTTALNICSPFIACPHLSASSIGSLLPPWF